MPAPRGWFFFILRKVLEQATGNTIGFTPGIQNALNALQDIQHQALAQGKNPKFVIVSHSSGGRSPVDGAANKEINTRVDSSDHGEIAYHPDVVAAFIDGLKELE